MTFFLLAAIMALAGTQESARVEQHPTPLWHSPEGWRVFPYPDEEMCDLGMPTPSGEYLTVGYAPRARRTNLSVTNRHATSLRVGETRPLTVILRTATGRTVTRRVITFRTLDADGTIVLSAGQTYPLLLDELAQASLLTVQTAAGAEVASVPLAGSTEAVAQLRACAAVAARIDPADPFLRH